MTTIKAAIRVLAAGGLAMAVGLAAVGAPAAGVGCQPADDGVAAAGGIGQNAALRYWRAWQSWDAEFSNRVYEAVHAADAGWTPDEALAKELADHGGLIGGVLRAAEFGPCDWGVQYEDGFLATLPHLSYLRNSGRILSADARRLTAERDFDGASRRVAALFHIARHCQSDRVMISSLVSAATASRAAEEARVLLNSGGMSAEMKKTVMTAALSLEGQAAGAELRLEVTFDGKDTFFMKAALRTERGSMLDSIAAIAVGERAGELLAEQVGPFIPGVPPELAKMSEAEVHKAIERARAVYTDALAAWDRQDAEASLKEIQRKVDAGEYGPLAKVVGPNLPKAWFPMNKARNDVAEVVAMLSGVPPAK